MIFSGKMWHYAICYFYFAELEILDFTQTDLAARSVMYVHTSDEELYMDSFVFGVSDGTSQVGILR